MNAISHLKIGVVGGGVVGRATARSYVEHCEVRVYDVLPERATHPLVSAKPNEAVLDCDVIFICLPTPKVKDDLACDTSAIDNFFSRLMERKDVFPDIVRSRRYVIRSTVPVGYTAKIAHQFNLVNVAHSPEFLTARCAATDAHLPARNIVGEPNGYLNEAGGTLCSLYANRFPGVPVFRMSSHESEMVKLITNGFFAVKLAFFNEVYEMVKAHGGSWEKVRAGVLADGRIAQSHTTVPGRDGSFGFGGECLPKDLANLIKCIFEAKATPQVSLAAAARNVADRMKTDRPSKH